MMVEKVYSKLPKSIQYAAKYAYGTIPISIRYGKVFRDTYAFLQESQWWSKEQLEEYQLEQLSKLLKHAYENVPYYRRVFDERGLKPRDIQDFNDFKKLPFITKEEIRNNFSNFIAQNYPKKRFKYVKTGGCSTGVPFEFYEEKKISDIIEWAFIYTQWQRVGFRMDDRKAALRGNVLYLTGKNKFWEFDPINKDLIFSSFHMNDENLPKYIKKFRKFKPDFIWAYPSAVTILAKFMEKNNIEPFEGLKALLCGSENLYPWQRKLLEKVFQCRVYSWYGQKEKVVLAAECEHSNYYHICPEYGITELVDKDGNEITEEGGIGEIVGTGFYNFVMPFIRYKTRDFAVYTRKKCECGRNYRLLEKIEGRLQDFMVAKNGHLISLITIRVDADVFDNMKQFQFYQDTKGELVLNVVKGDGYSERNTEYIKRAFYKRLGNDMHLELRFVDNIPRIQSGKYMFLIQKLPIEFWEWQS